MDLHIVASDKDQSLLEGWLFKKINAEAEKSKGLTIVPFGFALQKSSGALLGGVNGFLLFGSLHIDQIFVESELRGLGWGSQLLKAAETHGTKNGAFFVTLQTMDWQALPFYQKNGYALEFTRTGYPQTSSLFLLRKNLAS